MNRELLQPFLIAATRTIHTLTGGDAQEFPWNSSLSRSLEVSAVVGLWGRTTGSLVLSFTEPLAIKLASALLLIETDAIDDDAIDALSEVAAMIASSASFDFSGHDLAARAVHVVTGPRHRVRFPTQTQPESVALQTPWGSMRIELSLTPAPEATRV